MGARHVVDLAKAHVAAFNYLSGIRQKNFFDVFNLGTGHGVSVLELINNAEARALLAELAGGAPGPRTDWARDSHERARALAASRSRRRVLDICSIML